MPRKQQPKKNLPLLLLNSCFTLWKHNLMMSTKNLLIGKAFRLIIIFHCNKMPCLFDDDEKEKKPGEEDLSRRSITKNRPVFRLSLEKKIPQKSPEIALSDKISERPIEKKEEVHRQRFSFFKCFTGNANTQDQNQSSRKRNTEKKKHFMCLCWNMAYRCSILSRKIQNEASNL